MRGAIVRMCKALSDPTRASILTQLSEEALCVGALASRLGVTHSAVSQHLRVLREVGLVTGDKRGYWVHYSLDRGRVREISRQLSDWLEQLASAPPAKRAGGTCAASPRRAASVRDGRQSR
jgi:DNA-binding transcriptional ArsR family regulator